MKLRDNTDDFLKILIYLLCELANMKCEKVNQVGTYSLYVTEYGGKKCAKVLLLKVQMC